MEISLKNGKIFLDKKPIGLTFDFFEKEIMPEGQELSRAQQALYAGKGKMSNEYDRFNQGRGYNQALADIRAKLETLKKGV